ncbi:Hypothetical protein PBC10988_18890 [Planctomycetales bacterium 10988]|nr:Hypothetical protein PBC10988_18890 [Planctomycetales bacterium 10988]
MQRRNQANGRGFRLGLFAFLLIAVCSGWVSAQTSPEMDLQREIRRLMADLNAPQAARREAAAEKLKQAGPEILPYLPQPSRVFSAATNKLLEQVRRELEEAQSRAIWKPSEITLQGEFTLKELLAELAQQSGNRLVNNSREAEQTQSKITVNFQETPFWEALNEVLDQAKLELYPYESQTHTLMNRPENAKPMAERTVVRGAFRIEPQEIRLTNYLKTDDEQGVLQIEMMWESRLKPIAFYLQPQAFSFTDEEGNSLTLEQFGGRREIIPTAGETSQTFVLPFRVPSREIKKIGSVKGSIEVLLPGTAQTFTFSNLEAGVSQQQEAGNMTVSLDRIFQNRDIWDILVKLEFDDRTAALESYRGWVFQNEANLIDPQGNPVQAGLEEESIRNNRQIGVTYSYIIDGDLEGYTYRYITPTVILREPVTFELKDIPLP